MDVFYFLAAFLLVNRLKKRLKFSVLYRKWRSLITVATWSIIVLYILTFGLDDPFQHLVGAAILFGLIFYINREPDFQSQRPYLIANIPLIVMGLINSIALFVASDFYEKYNEYFGWVTVVAFAWIFGKWATSKKQEEELRISTE